MPHAHLQLNPARQGHISIGSLGKLGASLTSTALATTRSFTVGTELVLAGSLQ